MTERWGSAGDPIRSSFAKSLTRFWVSGQGMRVGDAKRVDRCGCGLGDRYRKIPPATGKSHSLERQTQAWALGGRKGWEEGGDSIDSVLTDARGTFGTKFTVAGREDRRSDLNPFQRRAIDGYTRPLLRPGLAVVNSRAVSAARDYSRVIWHRLQICFHVIQVPARSVVTRLLTYCGI